MPEKRKNFFSVVGYYHHIIGSPGTAVLIEGRLQWRRWTQEGQSCFTREVIAERIQCLPRPQADAGKAARGGSAPQGT
jgi:single-stranded DNA-binding protein